MSSLNIWEGDERRTGWVVGMSFGRIQGLESLVFFPLDIIRHYEGFSIGECHSRIHVLEEILVGG